MDEFQEFYDLNMSVDELIKKLDQKYPDQCIRPGTSLEQAYYEAGQRSVVDFLIPSGNQTRIKQYV